MRPTISEYTSSILQSFSENTSAELIVFVAIGFPIDISPGIEKILGYCSQNANKIAAFSILKYGDFVYTLRMLIYNFGQKKCNFDHLYRSRKEYIDLFHLNPVLMWVYDLDTYYFLDVNNAALEFYRYALSEYLLMTIRDICTVEKISDSANHSNDRDTSEVTYKSGKYPIEKKGEIIDIEIAATLFCFKAKRLFWFWQMLLLNLQNAIPNVFMPVN